MPTINGPDGTPVKVTKDKQSDSDGRAQVDAVIQSELEHASQSRKDAYSWIADYNYTGDDTILAIENTSANTLSIEGIWLSGDTDTVVKIHRPTSTYTTAGTSVTGVNLNDTGIPAEATATEDETGNTQGDIIWSGEIQAASDPYYVDFKGAVLLSKNKTIAVDYVTTGGACNVTIIGHYTHE